MSNSNNILIKSLMQLGLSDFESKVYEFLVTAREINLSELARQMSTNRMNIYRALAELEKLGLVSKKPDTGGLVVTSPSKILSLLQYQEIEINRTSKDFSSILPYIEDNFYLDKKEPKVQIYEGRRDFMVLLNRMIDELIPDSEILWLCEGEELYDIVDGEYFNLELASKRYAKNVKARVISNSKNKRIFLDSNKNKELNREVKKLPEGISTLGTISIAGDKVVLWNNVHPRAVLIDDKIMAKTFTDLFEFVWRES